LDELIEISGETYRLRSLARLSVKPGNATVTARRHEDTLRRDGAQIRPTHD
jgi:hypothetical protein